MSGNETRAVGLNRGKLLYFLFFIPLIPAPPEILVSPLSTTAFHGTTVMFACIAYGVPLPTFSWTRNSYPLVNDSSTVIYENKTTKEGIVFVKSVLEICSLRVVEDSGTYSCRAESVITSASANFELAVQGNFSFSFGFFVILLVYLGILVFVVLFVYSFVCLLVCLFTRSFTCLFVYSFVCLFFTYYDDLM